jgi:hypothetical protein
LFLVAGVKLKEIDFLPERALRHFIEQPFVVLIPYQHQEKDHCQLYASLSGQKLAKGFIHSLDADLRTLFPAVSSPRSSR